MRASASDAPPARSEPYGTFLNAQGGRQGASGGVKVKNMGAAHQLSSAVAHFVPRAVIMMCKAWVTRGALPRGFNAAQRSLGTHASPTVLTFSRQFRP
eukprot:1834485-Prymnesium_polylepis.1